MSDTPRIDATQYQWTRTLDLARTLERELAVVTRERDEFQRMAGANGLAGLEVGRENEALRAEVERLRSVLSDERIARHALKAGECPPDSVVVLVSSMRRLAALQEPTL